jgi:transcriptional regulator with XRE-family HTH domain
MKERGLTQRELAERSGVSVATIRQIQGAQPARRSPVTLAALSRALGWADDYLRQVVRPDAEPAPTDAGDDAGVVTRLNTVEERVRELIERVNRLETSQGGR